MWSFGERGIPLLWKASKSRARRHAKGYIYMLLSRCVESFRSVIAAPGKECLCKASRAMLPCYSSTFNRRGSSEEAEENGHCLKRRA